MTAYLSIRPLIPIKRWLESIEITDPAIARWICALIPARCPFERKIYLFNRLLFQISPLCKLNPFYAQFVLLRLKALACLVDDEW